MGLFSKDAICKRQFFGQYISAHARTHAHTHTHTTDVTFGNGRKTIILLTNSVALSPQANNTDNLKDRLNYCDAFVQNRYGSAGSKGT
jgi:hypothetical protein